MFEEIWDPVYRNDGYTEAMLFLWLLLAFAPATEQDLQRAIQANPRSPQPHTNYAIFLQQNGRVAEAVAEFRAALELGPKSPDAAYNLSLALLNNGDAAGAIAVLDRNPVATGDGFALRGAALNALGKTPDAIEALRRAVALDADNPDSLHDLAVTLLKVDANDEAIALLERGRRRFPRAAKIQAAAGMVAYLTGKNAEAVQAYEAAVKLEPSEADLHASLGDVYRATGEFAKAEAGYARAVRLDGAVAAYRVKRGRNLLDLQRRSEAEAEFSQALTREPENSEAHFQIGKLVAARADHAAAVKHFEQAVAANPKLKEAWYQLSLSYRRLGETEKATAAAERFRGLE
ncbi:MAG: tetratricopeptide repeat protein [Bryobacteraceae bacterium]